VSSTLPVAVEVGAGQSGPIGLLVIVVLCLFCVFLFRSMTKRLKRVPRSFDTPKPSSAQQSVSPADDHGDA
jgi:hypothetical protein